jgi:hypothetical protein
VEGTVTFTKTVQAEMSKRRVKGFQAFRGIVSELWLQAEEKVTEDLGRSAGLKSRPRVYLSGGATWAIATLTSPSLAVNQELYVKLSLTDLRRFHDQLSSTGRILPPDISGLDPKDKARLEREIRTIRDTFTPENLLAGSEILLGFARVLDWEAPEKELYFAKSGVVAWIVGYVEMERRKIR